MHKILLVGRSPLEHSGNGHMLNSLVRQLNHELYTPVCLGVGGNKTFLFADDELPYKLIQTGTNDVRVIGQILGATLDKYKPSVMITVGLDVWDLAPIHNQISSLKRRDHFATVGIMPYDLLQYRDDWAEWFSFYDIPCVYSQYGYNMLEGKVKNLRYFRPMLDYHEKFQPDNDARKLGRSAWFMKDDDTFVFGFVGANQIRKDPLRLIKAFSEFKKSWNDVALYMHTEMDQGVYTFQSYAEDCGLKMGDIITKAQGKKYSVDEMVRVFNGIDCLVNCTLQEGLSWTPLEAMLCGTPVIASNSTAHKELINESGILVPATELAFMPVRTKYGAGWVETYACQIDEMVRAMLDMYRNKDLRVQLRLEGIKTAEEWLAGVDNINGLIEDALVFSKPLNAAFPKKKEVLFAQHSSAGDVLMTTAILDQIKERHKGKRLVYMTQRQFADIVTDNPFIDEIIEWDESKLTEYEIVYNPHGQKILPGRWNSLDMMLHNMYAYFTNTKPARAKIAPKQSAVDLPERFIVVHTTGGHYSRIYRNLYLITPALCAMGYEIVQLGGKSDWYVKDAIDLRGTLSYRETAYVLQKATAAITVDSFMSHLAACLDIPQVCLFGPAPARVTKPYVEDPNKLICIEPNRFDVCKICGACYGEVKCDSPCIGTISPFVVLDLLKQLLPERTN